MASNRAIASSSCWCRYEIIAAASALLDADLSLGTKRAYSSYAVCRSLYRGGIDCGCAPFCSWSAVGTGGSLSSPRALAWATASSYAFTTESAASS